MERLWTLLSELNLFSSGSAATPTWWSSLALPHLVYPHSSPWITSRIRPAGAGISVSEARSITRNPAADRPTPALPAPTFQVRRRGPQDANAHCSSSSPVSSHSSLSFSPSSLPLFPLLPLLLFFSLLPLLTTPPYYFLSSPPPVLTKRHVFPAGHHAASCVTSCNCLRSPGALSVLMGLVWSR